MTRLLPLALLLTACAGEAVPETEPPRVECEIVEVEDRRHPATPGISNETVTHNVMVCKEIEK